MSGDLKILVKDPVTGALQLGLQRPPAYVTGLDKLVQIVALEMLNNGQRSIFNPNRGGGLRILIGTNVDYDDPGELFADVRLIVSRVEQSIKQGQVNTKRPPSERLASLQVADLQADETTLSVSVILAVVNEEQQVAQATVAMA